MTMIGRRERKLNRTRDTIAEAALALFDSRGYEQITMEEIADAADVAKGTLYNHFSSKEAVLAHSIHLQLAIDLENLKDQILARPSFEARVTALLTASAVWCENHRSYLSHFVRFEIQRACSPSEDPPVGQNEMIATYAALVEAAQSAGEVRSHLSPLRLATFLHYLHFASLSRWLTLDSVNLRDEFASIVDLFINGASERPTLNSGRP